MVTHTLLLCCLENARKSPLRSFFPSLNNLDLSLFTTHSTHNYAGIATNNCFFREIEIITPIMHIVVTLAKKSKITDDGDRLVCSAHSGGDGSIIKWTSSFLFEIKNTKNHCAVEIMWWKQCDRYVLWNENTKIVWDFVVSPISCPSHVSNKK